MAARDTGRILRREVQAVRMLWSPHEEGKEEEAAAVPCCGAQGFEDSLCEGDEPSPPTIGMVKSNYALVRPSWRRTIAAPVAVCVAACLLVCAAVGLSGRRLGLRAGARPAGPLPAGRVVPEQKQMVPWPRTCTYEATPVCPAKALFQNPEVLDVAAENLMRVGYYGLLEAEDRDSVRAAVEVGFKNISERLSKHAPEAASELDMIQLSATQKDAVVSSLRLMSDPRVQSLGFDVGIAIRESPSTEPEYLRRHIEERLRPRRQEIEKLRRTLLTPRLREIWARAHLWDLTLDPENVRVMRTSAGGMFAAVYLSLKDVYRSGATSAPLRLSEKTYAITGGVLEEGRALIDVIKMCTRLFGKELDVPLKATSLSNTYDFGSELLSCELHTAIENRVNFMKALFCPLKFGTQGMDVLRAADLNPQGTSIG